MNDIQKYTEKLEKLEKKQKYLDKCNKLTFGTYTKRLVAIIIAFDSYVPLWVITLFLS